MPIEPKHEYTVDDIGEAVTILLARDADRDQKIGEMYKLLVTGNGVPSLQERVRALERHVTIEVKFFWVFVTPLVGTFAIAAILMVAKVLAP